MSGPAIRERCCIPQYPHPKRLALAQSIQKKQEFKTKKSTRYELQVRRILHVLMWYCENVVSQCICCRSRSKSECLTCSKFDFETRLHALMISDGGLGTGFAFLIRSEDYRVTAVGASQPTSCAMRSILAFMARLAVIEIITVLSGAAASQVWAE